MTQTFLVVLICIAIVGLLVYHLVGPRETWDFDQAPWRAEPRALLHLRIVFVDGSVQTVVSDASWQGAVGPLMADSIRVGVVRTSTEPGARSRGLRVMGARRGAVAQRRARGPNRVV